MEEGLGFRDWMIVAALKGRGGGWSGERGYGDLVRREIKGDILEREEGEKWVKLKSITAAEVGNCYREIFQEVRYFLLSPYWLCQGEIARGLFYN